MTASSGGKSATSAAADLAAIQQDFARFATSHPRLRLYAALARHAGADAPSASLLLAARPGQRHSVLWLAALHHLVLNHPDLPLAGWYASVVGAANIRTDDPWPAVEDALGRYADEVTETIATHNTQTNEVNRCVYLAAGLVAAAADDADIPLSLVELGSSAGLLLGIDRYATSIRPQDPADRRIDIVGDPRSPVRCDGIDRSGTTWARAGLPRITGRAGVDLEPVQLDDDAAIGWLLACLWPDVPGRVERFAAARTLLATDPPRILAGDMIAGLPAAVAHSQTESASSTATASETHLVVFSSWAVHYLAPADRLRLERRVADLARDVRRVSWFSAEPPTVAPGIPLPPGVDVDTETTVLGLRRWRAGRELAPLGLGTCHHHGEWVDIHPQDWRS